MRDGTKLYTVIVVPKGAKDAPAAAKLYQEILSEPEMRAVPLLDEVSGGTPYGASTIAGGQGQRQPSTNELELARFQGAHVAKIAAKLAG